MFVFQCMVIVVEGLVVCQYVVQLFFLQGWYVVLVDGMLYYDQLGLVQQVLFVFDVDVEVGIVFVEIVYGYVGQVGGGVQYQVIGV